LDQRGRLLAAALGFAGCSLPSYDRALHALRAWLDSWSGIGRVAVGMARQGYDLQLTRYDDKGWRATFYTTGTEHSPTSATGTGWERTPGRATQRAAWEALKGADGAPGGAPARLAPELERLDVDPRRPGRVLHVRPDLLRLRRDVPLGHPGRRLRDLRVLELVERQIRGRARHRAEAAAADHAGHLLVVRDV